MTTSTADRAGPAATGAVAEARCACGAFLAWISGTGWCHLADLCVACYATSEETPCPEGAEHGRFTLLTPHGLRPCPVAPLSCLACDEVLDAESECWGCGHARCCGCCETEPDEAADAAYDRLREDALP